MRTLTTAAALAATAVLALTACEDSTSPGSTSSASGLPTAATSTGDSKASSDTATLPNLVGKGLQSAQDEAQVAGFYALTSHDAVGRGRNQILESQVPA
ncbi:hypothetical protein OG905_00505 [Streptomyces sp. NBC_00322]|uniref:hypothetical protein n=1 Tax=Streptomyces sp. NBC_00322 TaxID=2975712 RepID=UPI002E28B3FE|nr:hypothetical protein [Streptomyces sp. NBC_00322]